jgi:hypothetical protein
MVLEAFVWFDYFPRPCYYQEARRTMVNLAACLAVAILTNPTRGGLVYPDCVNGPLKSNLVCNTSATPAARAAALVAAMSNSDKLANLVKYVSCSPKNTPTLNPSLTSHQQLPRLQVPRPKRLPMVERSPARGSPQPRQHLGRRLHRRHPIPPSHHLRRSL